MAILFYHVKRVNSDDVVAWFKAASKGYYEVSYASVSICCCLMGIIGALRFNLIKGRFNIFLAALPLILYTLNVAGLLYLLIAVHQKEFIAVTIGCVANIIFAYPHLVFISEIKRGVIKIDTYKSIQSHWCCCCKKKARGAPTMQPEREKFDDSIVT